MTTDPTPAVLFLDVDGVLNRCGKSNQGLETDKCDLLAELCRMTGCKIVVSSTWRKSGRLMNERLLPMFQSRGIECIGETPIHERASGFGGIIISPARRDEIKEWLSLHPEVTRYAIVDDDHDADDGTGRYVQTGSFDGLTQDKALQLSRILMQ